jgi:hypothetical protein
VINPTSPRYELIDIAWAAGIYEGEGCVSRHVTAYNSHHVRIRMTDEDIIDRLVEIFPFAHKYKYQAKGKPTYKLAYDFCISGAERVQAFLAMIWPWLGERRRRDARAAIIAVNQTVLRFSKPKIAEILAMKAAGYTQTRIAAIMGCNQGQISKVVRRANGRNDGTPAHTHARAV